MCCLFILGINNDQRLHPVPWQRGLEVLEYTLHHGDGNLSDAPVAVALLSPARQCLFVPN